MAPRKTKKPVYNVEMGFFLFTDTWVAGQIATCSPGAAGLWYFMLPAMWKQEPRGVLPGDRQGLSEVMAQGGMEDAWWEVWGQYLPELERKRVFSRGIDVDEGYLPDDAIVNRKMYRDWCKSVGRSEKASRASKARWEKEKGEPKGRITIEEVKAEVANLGCSIDAQKGVKNDAKAMLKVALEVVADQELVTIAECLGDAQGPMLGVCHSKPNYTKTKDFEGGIEPVSTIIPTLKADLIGKKIYARILRATRDDHEGDWGRWWKALVKCFDEAGKLEALDRHLVRVEANRDEDGESIKGPRRYLSKRSLASARVEGLKVPSPPKAANEAA